MVLFCSLTIFCEGEYRAILVVDFFSRGCGQPALDGGDVRGPTV